VSPAPPAIVLLVCALLAACSTCEDGGRRRPDIVIVSVDALRADRIAGPGAGETVAPGLDAFAKEGVLFEAHHAQASMTLPSHASLFTGLDPDHHGVLTNGFYRLGKEASTLAELLSAAGYATAAFVASSTLASKFGLDQGFASYDDRLNPGSKIRRIDAEEVTDRAVAWMEARGERESLFLFVHYFDAHKPITAPARFAFPNAYDSGAAYADEQIARLLDGLRRCGRYDGALIAVTADHGQSLGEHDLQGHTAILYEQALRIPLIVRFPGGRGRGSRVGALTRSVDLMPTALSAAGLRAPAGIDGADLTALARGASEPAPRESFSLSTLAVLPQLDQDALISGRWKLISKTANGPTDEQSLVDVQIRRPEWLPDGAVPEKLLQRVRQKVLDLAAGSPDVRQLFDLAADPAEEVNLYGARPDVATALEARIAGRSVPRAGAPGAPFLLDGDVEEKLRALGYLY